MLNQDRPDMVTSRAQNFARDNSLESALRSLNDEIQTLHDPSNTDLQPCVVLIVGPPRCGSTLLMQWIASTRCFAYPSNLVARFFGNPAFGFRVQQVLHDFDTRNQIGLRNDDQDVQFKSELGRTMGALAPSEFWYWWRRFFQFPDIQQLTHDQLSNVDSHRFLSELSAMQTVNTHPLVMKGMHMNWHLDYLAGLSDKFIFLRLKRELKYVAQSMLLARDQFFGDRSRWWSYKPAEYAKLKELSPIEQVAGQAFYTEQAITNCLENVPQNQIIEIEYEQFCSSPPAFWERLAKGLHQNGCDIPNHCPIDVTYSKSEQTKILPEEFEQLESACISLENSVDKSR